MGEAIKNYSLQEIFFYALLKVFAKMLYLSHPCTLLGETLNYTQQDDKHY